MEGTESCFGSGQMLNSRMKKITILLIQLLFLHLSVKSQRIDWRDINYYFLGDFLKTNRFLDDSIIVCNYYLDDIDTFLVLINNLDSNFKSIRIFKNNSIHGEYKAINSKIEGPNKMYNYRNKQWEIYYYHEGKIISPTFFYDENNNLNGIYSLNELSRSGLNLRYFKNGRVSAKQFYNDTSEARISLRYFESGNIKAKVYGKKKNENYILFYENGSVRKTGQIHNEVFFPFGQWKEFYPNGKLKSIKHYWNSGTSNSYKSGVWEFYDEEGKLIRKEVHNEREEYVPDENPEDYF